VAVFYKPGDYGAIAPSSGCRPFRFCFIPNHRPLVLWSHGGGDLSRFVGWVTNTPVKRYRRHYHDTAAGRGHLYQGRSRGFPAREDGPQPTVLRYVRATPCGRRERRAVIGFGARRRRRTAAAGGHVAFARDPVPCGRGIAGQRARVEQRVRAADSANRPPPRLLLPQGSSAPPRTADPSGGKVLRPDL
jgi:hypothetical protein